MRKITLVAMFSVVLLAVMAHIMTEEEHLGNGFGTEYSQYCERVPRYVV